MRVAVVLEHRFERTPDGRVWTDGPFPRSFFDRYLEVFDRVRVVARVAEAPSRGEGRIEVAGGPVEVFGLPCYRGALDYLRLRGRLLGELERALRPGDAVILRAPSQAGVLAAAVLERQGREYAAEVVGDPRDAFAPGSYEHPLRPLLRWKHALALGRQCRRASATAYVTREALQRRYPPDPNRPTTSYSSVELRDDAFVDAPPEQPRVLRRLVSVGSMEHLYKGQDTLIEALALCRVEGVELALTLVGDGRFRPRLEELARTRGVGGQVRFAGRAPSGAAVRELLDRAELFALPSRQEGLPRALLEAMARGLPAIASRVGGVPELLPEDLLVPADHPGALAGLLLRLAGDAERRERIAADAWRRARRYHDRVLSPRRREFYGWVAARSLAGLKAGLPDDDRTTAEPTLG